MEHAKKLLGKIVSLNSKTREVTLKIDFFTPDIQEMLEIILKEQSQFTFGFWKPFRQSKSWGQLKKYYLTINKLLTKLGEYPDADKIKALDEEIKKRVFPCDILELNGVKIPLVPSKANMSWEEMSMLIKYLYDTYDTYGVLLEDDMEAL